MSYTRLYYLYYISTYVFSTQSTQFPFLQSRLFLDINTTWVISATATATAIGAVSLEGGVVGQSLLLICAISLTFCHLGSLQLSSSHRNRKTINEQTKRENWVSLAVVVAVAVAVLQQSSCAILAQFTYRITQWPSCSSPPPPSSPSSYSFSSCGNCQANCKL